MLSVFIALSGLAHTKQLMQCGEKHLISYRDFEAGNVLSSLLTRILLLFNFLSCI